jgi:hypothetical protein
MTSSRACLGPERVCAQAPDPTRTLLVVSRSGGVISLETHAFGRTVRTYVAARAVRRACPARYVRTDPVGSQCETPASDRRSRRCGTGNVSQSRLLIPSCSALPEACALHNTKVAGLSPSSVGRPIYERLPSAISRSSVGRSVQLPLRRLACSELRLCVETSLFRSTIAYVRRTNLPPSSRIRCARSRPSLPHVIQAQRNPLYKP